MRWSTKELIEISARKPPGIAEMNFDYSEKVGRLRTQLNDFMQFHVEP